jgi:aspartate racemase
VAAIRVGLIGGLSWESTAQYYRRLNEDVTKDNPWRQPQLVIDSLDFGLVNGAQVAGERGQVTGELVAAARRLAAAGCTHLAICANTAHEDAEAVAAVGLPLIDIRVAVAAGVRRAGASSLGLLATHYCIDRDFYARVIQQHGVRVIRPTPPQTEVLQRIIFDELCLGTVSPGSRQDVSEIADDLRRRGADVIGLCCTELGLLVSAADVGSCVDSLDEHVRAILDVLAEVPGHG